MGYLEDKSTTIVKLRPELLLFAETMECVLRQHDAKKGDSWKTMDINKLNGLLDEEIDEYKSKHLGHAGPDPNPKAMAEELIDIANICMMLYARWLYPTLKEQPTAHKASCDFENCSCKPPKESSLPLGLPVTAVISKDELHILWKAIEIVAREKARKKAQDAKDMIE